MAREFTFSIHPSVLTRRQFILEGIPAVLTAPVVYFYYPDYPESARWLTEAELELAVKRLAGDNGSHGSHSMTWPEAKAVLTNWRLYFHCKHSLIYLGEDLH